MCKEKSNEFREKIRLLERSLELLKQSDGSGCCCSLTLSQCHALVEIGRREAISLKELAVILLLDVSTVSRTVDSLVTKKLVERITSTTDRRSISISLTEKGSILFHSIEQDMNQKFHRIFEYIDANQQDIVLNSLQLVIEAVNKSKLST